MKTCRSCGKTDVDHEKLSHRDYAGAAMAWYRCPVHGNFCGKCINEGAMMAKPTCKICGKILISRRWF